MNTQKSSEPSTAARRQLLPLPRTRREVIDQARMAYDSHVETMAEVHPDLVPLRPWDDQDAAVREAWIEYATPDEKAFP